MRSSLFSFVLAIFLLITVPAHGEQLPAALQVALDQAGVPVYPGAVFCTGTTTAGIRYATADGIDKVRQWYQQQRPKWAVFEKPAYGIWVLYEGPAKIGMMEWTKYNMAQVGKNENLPAWHNLSKTMTTEIVLGVADRFK